MMSIIKSIKSMYVHANLSFQYYTTSLVTNYTVSYLTN